MYFADPSSLTKPINEDFIGSNNVPKRNRIPIVLDTTYVDARIGMINTHLITALMQAKDYKPLRYGTVLGGIIGILGGIFLGPIGAIAGLPFILKPLYNATGALIRQHDARDFVLLPTIQSKERFENISEDEVRSIMDQFFKHPVVAANDGEVIRVSENIRNGANFNPRKDPAEGNYIILKHFNGKYFSLYAHLYYGSIRVKEGEFVKKGQIIGTVGSTGNSSGPHLHFEMQYNNPESEWSVGKKLDHFDDYMYTPFEKIEFYNGACALNTKRLTLNKTGKLNDCCFIS